MNRYDRRSPRGLRLTRLEMRICGVPERIGARFTTDQLDIFPNVYEVVELTEHGAVVRFVERASGSR